MLNDIGRGRHLGELVLENHMSGAQVKELVATSGVTGGSEADGRRCAWDACEVQRFGHVVDLGVH